jgi:hypothetical protein
VYFTGCPNVPALRELLARCIRRLGVATDVREVNTDDAGSEDRYRQLPSPALLVDGVDVLGSADGAAASCRLTMPTEEELLAVLGGRNEKR